MRPASSSAARTAGEPGVASGLGDGALAQAPEGLISASASCTQTSRRLGVLAFVIRLAA